MALFWYHFYLVQKKEKPEEGFAVNATFLDAARWAKFMYEDLTILLTRPPVQSLLMERPPMPPGHVPFKVLVLNLNGTLIHSEYKVSCEMSLTLFSSVLVSKYSKDPASQSFYNAWPNSTRSLFSVNRNKA